MSERISGWVIAQASLGSERDVVDEAVQIPEVKYAASFITGNSLVVAGVEGETLGQLTSALESLRKWRFVKGTSLILATSTQERDMLPDAQQYFGLLQVSTGLNNDNRSYLGQWIREEYPTSMTREVIGFEEHNVLVEASFAEAKMIQGVSDRIKALNLGKTFISTNLALPGSVKLGIKR